MLKFSLLFFPEGSGKGARKKVRVQIFGSFFLKKHKLFRFSDGEKVVDSSFSWIFRRGSRPAGRGCSAGRRLCLAKLRRTLPAGRVCSVGRQLCWNERKRSRQGSAGRGLEKSVIFGGMGQKIPRGAGMQAGGADLFGGIAEDSPRGAGMFSGKAALFGEKATFLEKKEKEQAGKGEAWPWK